MKSRSKPNWELIKIQFYGLMLLFDIIGLATAFIISIAQL